MLEQTITKKQWNRLVGLCVMILGHERADQAVTIGGCDTNSAEAGNVARAVLRILNISDMDEFLEAQIQELEDELQEIG